MAKTTKAEAARIAALTDLVSAYDARETAKEGFDAIVANFNTRVEAAAKAGITGARIRTDRDPKKVGDLHAMAVKLMVGTLSVEEQALISDRTAEKGRGTPYQMALNKAKNKVSRLAAAIDALTDPAAKAAKAARKAETPDQAAVRLHLDAVTKEIARLVKITQDEKSALVETATALHKSLVHYFDTATKSLPRK